MEKITKDRIWFLIGMFLIIGALFFLTRSCDNKIVAEVPQFISSSDNK